MNGEGNFVDGGRNTGNRVTKIMNGGINSVNGARNTVSGRKNTVNSGERKYL